MPPARRRGRRPLPRTVAKRYMSLYQRRRIRNRMGLRVHSFTEKCQLTSISIPSGATNYGVIPYQINSLINWAAYAGLFDLYKLKAVKLTLISLASQSEVTFNNSSLQAGALPMLYIAPNRDPYVPAPLSIADVINDDDCKIIRFSKPSSFYLSNPKPDLKDDTGSSVPFQFNVKTQPWLTTGGNAQTIDQSTVKHYGHRWAITNNASSDIVVQVYVKYFFEMKEQD